MARKLRGDGEVGNDPLVDFALCIIEQKNIETHIVSDEDWHAHGWWEFEVFDEHCLMGEQGTKLLERIEEFRWHERFDCIRANSLNISTDSRYSQTLSRIIGKGVSISPAIQVSLTTPSAPDTSGVTSGRMTSLA